MGENVRKKIGTHSGNFHCDESLACFMLRYTNQFKNSEIIRSRDPKVLETLDILVDVGGVYDTATHRYDHHQKGFFETLNENYKTKLSSAGLIYKHFGEEVITNLISTFPIPSNYISVPITPSVLSKIYFRLYDKFIESVDAIDNGISQYPNNQPALYSQNTDLSSRISRLNPPWHHPDPNYDEAFQLAVDMTGKEFTDQLYHIYDRWLPARSIVEDAINDRFNRHSSGEIIVLKQYCPSEDHLYEIEKELNIVGHIKYILFPEGTNSNWRIKVVSNEGEMFSQRKTINPAWHGLRDQTLSELSKIDDCIFVHANGFIGGNKTYEGAFAMAVQSLSV